MTKCKKYLIEKLCNIMGSKKQLDAEYSEFNQDFISSPLIEPHHITTAKELLNRKIKLAEQETSLLPHIDELSKIRMPLRKDQYNGI